MKVLQRVNEMKTKGICWGKRLVFSHAKDR